MLYILSVLFSGHTDVLCVILNVLFSWCFLIFFYNEYICYNDGFFKKKKPYVVNKTEWCEVLFFLFKKSKLQKLNCREFCVSPEPFLIGFSNNVLSDCVLAWRCWFRATCLISTHCSVSFLLLQAVELFPRYIYWCIYWVPDGFAHTVWMSRAKLV